MKSLLLLLLLIPVLTFAQWEDQGGGAETSDWFVKPASIWLPLSGGTMTGDLTLTAADILLDDSKSIIWGTDETLTFNGSYLHFSNQLSATGEVRIYSPDGAKTVDLNNTDTGGNFTFNNNEAGGNINFTGTGANNFTGLSHTLLALTGDITLTAGSGNITSTSTASWSGTHTWTAGGGVFNDAVAVSWGDTSDVSASWDNTDGELEFTGGDIVFKGNVGVGVDNPSTSLTVLASNGEGLSLVDIGGIGRTLFDINAGSSGRFKLWDNLGNAKINFVAGGSGTFIDTNVDFISRTDADAAEYKLFSIDSNDPTTPFFEVVVNEDSRNYIDFRVETDANSHMLFVDASTNSVGINNSTSTSFLEIKDNIGNRILRINNTDIRWNLDSVTTMDYQIRSLNKNNMFFIDSSLDKIGIGMGGGTPPTINATLDVIGDVRMGDSTTNYMTTSSTGDVTFVGSGGLAYGGVYAYDQNETMTAPAGAGIANKIQITGSSGADLVFEANQAANNTNPEHAEGHVKIVKAGDYYCSVSITADSIVGGGGRDRFGFAVYKNNGATLMQNLHIHRTLVSGAGGNAGSITLTGIITNLAVNDTVEVWYYNEDDTSALTIDDISLTVFQLGGV